MKFLRFLLFFALIIGLACLGLLVTGNQHIFKGFWAVYMHGHKSATIDDARFFDTRPVSADAPKPISPQTVENQVQLSSTLRKTLDSCQTVAFMVYKDGAPVYEEYWEGYSDTSHSNSFSMAKTVVTLLSQIAIQQGHFKSWDDKVSTYLPELEGAYRNELSLRHLSQMSAGLQWNESYSNPFDITAKAYYGNRVEQLLLEEVPVVNKPGEHFEYQSGATQLLALCLIRATGSTLSDYLSENLWTPLNATQNAYWHLDRKEGTELAYCCLNSNARDFARFGLLLMNNGRWNEKQIIDADFINEMCRPHLDKDYGMGIWVDYDDHVNPVYQMWGKDGQYVIAIPAKDLVIVKLSHKQLGKSHDRHTRDFHVIVDEVVKYFGV